MRKTVIPLILILMLLLLAASGAMADETGRQDGGAVVDEQVAPAQHGGEVPHVPVRQIVRADDEHARGVARLDGARRDERLGQFKGQFVGSHDVPGEGAPPRHLSALPPPRGTA